MDNMPPSSLRTAALLLLGMLMLLFSVPAAQATQVGAGYQSIRGSNVVFAVQIGSPAPSSLIIEHLHSRGILLRGTSPGANKINNEDGIAKWFLKNPQPGTYQFSLSFNRPVNPGNLKLILRYKDPLSGSFAETLIQP